MQEEASTFAAFVGIDWADRKHDIRLQVPGVDTAEMSILEHRPSAIQQWALGLRERFQGRRIAVCLELSQGPIVSALLAHATPSALALRTPSSPRPTPFPHTPSPPLPP